MAFAAPIEHGVERSDALMQFWKRKDILQTHSLRLLLLLRLCGKKLYEKFCMALNFIKIPAMLHSWFLKITGAPDHSLWKSPLTGLRNCCILWTLHDHSLESFMHASYSTFVCRCIDQSFFSDQMQLDQPSTWSCECQPQKMTGICTLANKFWGCGGITDRPALGLELCTEIQTKKIDYPQTP